MAGKYARVFFDPEKQVIEGAPLEILSRGLFKDMESGTVFALIKFVNTSSRQVSSARISVQPIDSTGALCGEAVSYDYRSLAVDKGGFFGTKTPVLIKSEGAVSFKVMLDQVSFADGSVFSFNGIAFERDLSGLMDDKQEKAEAGESSRPHKSSEGLAKVKSFIAKVGRKRFVSIVSAACIGLVAIILGISLHSYFSHSIKLSDYP